jgi:threonylcarbamoyladenosine tRNA methylthiotransferase MtaB
MCTRTFATITFGCKVNQYESQAVREGLIGLGFVPVKDPESAADAYVVNTCAVTGAAYRDGVRRVRRLVRRRPGALVVVTGCGADSNPGDFPEGVPVFGNSRKNEIAEFVAERLGGQERRRAPAEALRISRFEGHKRAFLKIQDGCDLRCSFCIIPRLRGPSRRRSVEEALDEARRLSAHGYREIVLTGVHLGGFGDGLPNLVRGVLRVPGIRRVRLSSIEANEVGDALIDLMAAEPRLCPHLHLPLQSGDDDVLRAMRRRYNAAQFRRTVERVRRRVDEPSFTTDVIVGFPTENDEAFERTLEFCRSIGFARVHPFPYSHRAGTDASTLPDLPAAVKRERLGRLERQARSEAESVCRRFVGREVEVLVESGRRGYTERYLHAEVVDGAPEPGRLVRVRATDAKGDLLLCDSIA